MKYDEELSIMGMKDETEKAKLGTMEVLIALGDEAKEEFYQGYAVCTGDVVKLIIDVPNNIFMQSELVYHEINVGLDGVVKGDIVKHSEFVSEAFYK